MPIDTNVGSETSRPDHKTEKRLRQRLSEIKDRLLEYRPDITDDDLRHAITRWIIIAQRAPSSDAEEHVSSLLADIRRDNPMYRTRGHDDGTACFPDRCEGCRHYGVACPVITDNDQIDRRERIMETADSQAQLRRRLREYSIDNGCHVLQEELVDITEAIQPLVEHGQLLLMAAEDTVMIRDESEAVARALAGQETLEDLSIAPDDMGEFGDLEERLGDVDRTEWGR